MNTARILALPALAVLTASLLAGCGDTKTPAPSTTEDAMMTEDAMATEDAMMTEDAMATEDAMMTEDAMATDG